MTPDYSALKALAKAATPGPWETKIQYDDDDCALVDGTAPYVIDSKGLSIADLVYALNGVANAAYIAAANPQAILALIERVERLQEALILVTTHMDRQGGDRDGMPECPWCHEQDGDGHAPNCELVRARAAIAEEKL